MSHRAVLVCGYIKRRFRQLPSTHGAPVLTRLPKTMHYGSQHRQGAAVQPDLRKVIRIKVKCFHGYAPTSARTIISFEFTSAVRLRIGILTGISPGSASRTGY